MIKILIQLFFRWQPHAHLASRQKSIIKMSRLLRITQKLLDRSSKLFYVEQNVIRRLLKLSLHFQVRI